MLFTAQSHLLFSGTVSAASQLFFRIICVCVCVSMKTTLVSTCSSECVLSSVILSWSQWLLCGFVTHPL